MSTSDPVRDWRAELARWAAAPPRRSGAVARARLLAALPARPTSAPNPWRLVAVGGAVALACLVVLLGRDAFEVAGRVSTAARRPSSAPAPRAAPEPAGVIVHTLSSGTRLYFTLPQR